MIVAPASVQQQQIAHGRARPGRDTVEETTHAEHLQAQ